MKAIIAALLACVMYAGCGGGAIEEPTEYPRLDSHMASLLVFHKEFGEYVDMRNRLMTETASIATATTTSKMGAQAMPCPLDHKELRSMVLTSTAAPLDQAAIKSLYEKYGGCVPGGSSFLEALAKATSKEDPNMGWYSADRLGKMRLLKPNGLFGMMDATCEKALADGATCEPFDRDGMTTEDVDVQAAGAAAYARDLWTTITVASKYSGRNISDGETGLILFALGHAMGIDTLQATVAQATKRGSSDDPCEWIVTAMWRHRSGSTLEDDEKARALSTCRQYPDNIMKRRTDRLMKLNSMMGDFADMSTRLNKLIGEEVGYELNMYPDGRRSVDCPLVRDELRGEMPLSTMTADDLDKLYNKYDTCTPHGATMLRIFAKIESNGNPRSTWPENRHLGKDHQRFGLFTMSERFCAATLRRYSMEGTCPNISTDVEVQMAAGAATLDNLSRRINDYDTTAAIKYSGDRETYLMALVAGYSHGEGALNRILQTPLKPNGPAHICETLVDFWTSYQRYEIPLYPITPSEKQELVGRCLDQGRK